MPEDQNGNLASISKTLAIMEFMWLWTGCVRTEETQDIDLLVNADGLCMSIDVYIDNDVFDFLFERKLDLAVELPCGEYCLFLTREAEFEIPPIPKPQLMLREPGRGRHTGHGDPLLHCPH